MKECITNFASGGLTGFATSSRMVVSAATGDAGTVNVLTTAWESLLVELLWHLENNDQSKVPSEGTGEEVRKEEALEKKGKPILGAVAFTLSFLIFGSVPPIVYGFSFRESDDRDQKIAAVALATFFCIGLLALLKASVQTPHNYMDTAIQEIAYGYEVSGLSYAIGSVVNKLREKVSGGSAGAGPILTLSAS